VLPPEKLTETPQAISRALIFRLLGHVLLSGALHVAYQASDRVKGQYIVCVLYKSCLVLATPNRSYLPYTVVASIGLANGSIEQSDNGRGMLIRSFASVPISQHRITMPHRSTYVEAGL
jgi:hypothetical protein